MRNENLYGWVFVYNPYTELWNAARREDYTLLYTATSKKSPKVLRSKDVNTLIELIIKTNGEPQKVKCILNNKVKHLIVEKC